MFFLGIFITISIISRFGSISDPNQAIILYILKIAYLISFPFIFIPVPIVKIYNPPSLAKQLFINFWLWVFSGVLLIGGLLILHNWNDEYVIYYFIVAFVIFVIFGGLSGLIHVVKIKNRGANKNE
jgi:hypothetical protein